LITSDGDRGWRNMLRAGSTITLEAWDIKFKPNLDWNHAWGAAPANILPRYVLGVRPLEPGFSKMIIQPQLGSLTHVEGKVPTIRGPVRVKVDAAKRRMEVDIPKNTTARIILPWAAHRPIEVGAGRHVFEP
ncbi:MAG: alpha-L-rhamnosidase, partial [Humisphaera sp.]|nr:alpha-L-rhamnosidase [Humisphaera sp.]